MKFKICMMFLSSLVFIYTLFFQAIAQSKNPTNDYRSDDFKYEHRRPPPRRKPPIEALYACEEKKVGSSCIVHGPHGALDGQCRMPKHLGLKVLYCIPDKLPPPPPILNRDSRGDGYGPRLDNYDRNDGYGIKRDDGY